MTQEKIKLEKPKCEHSWVEAEVIDHKNEEVYNLILCEKCGEEKI